MDKKLNLSIVKAFRLLDFFTDKKKEWGVRELALKSGYNKSTTYRLLSTLENLHVVHQKSNEKYCLGSKLFELGNRVAIYESLINATKHIVKTIAKDIRETVLFGVLKKQQVFYISKAESPQGLKISTSIGSYQPLHATAMGKILLVFSSEQQKKSLLDTIPFQAYTAQTIANRNQLEHELLKVQKNRYALDLEEYELGLICIAIPVFNKNQEFIGSISASGPSSRFELKNVESYLKLMRKEADRIQF